MQNPVFDVLYPFRYPAPAMLNKLRWRRRLRTHGYLKRSKTADGRKVLANRRRIGRKRLTVQHKKKKRSL